MRHTRPSGKHIGLLAIVCLWPASAIALRAEEGTELAAAIRPLLAKRCVACHNGSDRKGGLDLTQRSTVLAGGDSGRVVEPGKPDDSLLWQHVSSGEMPPKKPLSDAEQALLRRWLENGIPWSGGAIDPFEYTTDLRAGYDWWSLQPVVVTAPPTTDDHGWSVHPIDAFVLAKLRECNLQPSPPAERRVLIRRLYSDLLGLLPAPEEVAEFVADEHPLAFERLVNEVLASPHYGERWARHWLDIVRFGESQGFERDKLRPNAWPYRDWLIDAFNRDLPYQEFARLQLAGDVLRPDDADAITATGFYVAGPYDEVGQQQQSLAMRAVVREDELEDIVGTVAQTFLGLTVNCARCHDHKFDPVSQKEYYRLCAALAGVRHGERELPPRSQDSRELNASRAYSARLLHLQRRLEQIESPFRASAGVLISAAAEQELASKLSDAQRSGREQLKFEIEHVQEQLSRLRQSKIYTTTAHPPLPTYVLVRGNPAQRGDVVLPGGIASVRGLPAEFNLAADAPDAERRRQLAHWITDERNPLFARVIVNRLWQYHYGAGLVSTSNDFGFNGSRPSHPELLDWLANELVRSGWSMKHVQRLIVTSATYRQSSSSRPDAMAVDADNRWLWRNSPTRLEAEVLRDVMLLLAGELNTSMYGPGYYDFRTFTLNSQFYEMRDPVGVSFQRRSIYRTWLRSGRNPFLDVFDCPDPSTKTPQRAVTTTPLQALSLLNNSFVFRMADCFAARVQREAGADADTQVVRVFEHAFGRRPDPLEQRQCVTVVREHGLAPLCRAIFNSNELLYVD